MNIMKIFGFDSDEDDYDEEEEYAEDRRRKTSRKNSDISPRSGSGNAGGFGKLIIYNGIASDDDKRRLREAFNNGAMILIDLHGLTQRDFEEEGKDFITFMGGVAFARSGEIKFIEPAQYLVTPRAEMFEIWSRDGEE